MFTWDRNPNKLHCGSHNRSGIRQDLLFNLWRSGFRHYLCVHLTLGISWEGDRHDTVDHCLRLQPRRIKSCSEYSGSFCRVWHVLVFCSGGLLYKWQWRISYKPQFFTFIVRAAGVKFHGRVWHYIQRRTGVCVCMYVYIYILHKFSGDL
jgi:hypothetical protein